MPYYIADGGCFCFSDPQDGNDTALPAHEPILDPAKTHDVAGKQNQLSLR